MCRPFVVQNIPFTDMILVVVHATCPDASDPFASPMNVIPSEVNYNGTSLNCQKIKYKHRMPRRRPPICIKEHEKVMFVGLMRSVNPIKEMRESGFGNIVQPLVQGTCKFLPTYQI